MIDHAKSDFMNYTRALTEAMTKTLLNLEKNVEKEDWAQAYSNAEAIRVIAEIINKHSRITVKKNVHTRFVEDFARIDSACFNNSKTGIISKPRFD